MWLGELVSKYVRYKGLLKQMTQIVLYTLSTHLQRTGFESVLQTLMVVRPLEPTWKGEGLVQKLQNDLALGMPQTIGGHCAVLQGSMDWKTISCWRWVSLIPVTARKTRTIVFGVV